VRATFLLAASLVPIAAASGQMVSAHAVVAAPRHNAHFAGVTERMDGLWVGGAVEFEVGRLRLSGSGMRGRVTSPDPGSVPKRDVGELALNGHYRVRPWLGFEMRYTARAFSSAAGYNAGTSSAWVRLGRAISGRRRCVPSPAFCISRW